MGSTDRRAPQERGHERRDVNVRVAFYVTLAFLAAIPLIVLGMKWTFKVFAAREARSQPPPATLIGRGGETLPPEPRLQMSPTADLRLVREEEDAVLGSYGWVDRKAGRVRIPIARAIDLLAESGLPARAADTHGSLPDPPR